MNDNKSAFRSNDYDRKITQTLPFYEQFYEQVIELVKAFHCNAVKWLDAGCGTGKMGSAAFANFDDIEKFVFCDASEEMIKIAKERFKNHNAEFLVCDIQKLAYADEFDIITAIQVNHYLRFDERRIALRKCYEALKENGLFNSFENFAPFTGLGKYAYPAGFS